MYVANKLVTIAIVAYTAWIFQRILLLLFNLYYPTVSIPILQPTSRKHANLPKHSIAWNQDFEYLVSVYISDQPQIFSFEFFSTAQLLYRSPLLIAKHKSGLVLAPALKPEPEQDLKQKEKHTKTSSTKDISELAKNSIVQTLNVKLPAQFWSTNGTNLFAHTLVHSKNSLIPDPTDSQLGIVVNLRDPYLIGTTSQLIDFRPRAIDHKVSLLKHAQGEANIKAQKQIYKDLYEPHAKSRLSVEVVFENHRFPLYRFPVDTAPYIRLIEQTASASSDKQAQNSQAQTKSQKAKPVPAYLPILSINPLSTRTVHWKPLANYTISESNSNKKSKPNGEAYLNVQRLDSETAKEFELQFTVSSVKLGWFRLSNFLSNNFASMAKPNSLFQISAEEIDNLKEMVYESDYKLLLITLMASILHIVFEFLAYKEDIAFWSKSGNELVHEHKIKSTHKDPLTTATDTPSSQKTSEREKHQGNNKRVKGSTQTQDQNGNTDTKTKQKLQPTQKIQDHDNSANSQWGSVSRSALLMKAVSSVVGMLYLYDHKESTSILIIVGSLVSAVLECWKLLRIYNISSSTVLSVISGPSSSSDTSSTSAKDDQQLNSTTNVEKSKKYVTLVKGSTFYEKNDELVGLVGSGEGEGEGEIVKSEQQIRAQVDNQTVSIMFNVGAPIIIAYAAYSLFFEKHSSYFSFFIHLALTAVYGLEFIQMLPQLLINHKLKSVEAIPITVFMFRFFTTFIDDLFAMVIPMPTLTRIGTFRDDIVFFVLCWQWWSYPSKKSKNSQKKQTKEEPNKPEPE